MTNANTDATVYRHKDQRLDEVIQHAFSRGWRYKPHRSAHIWGEIACVLDLCGILVPLSPRSPQDVATSIEIKVNECDH